MGDNKISNRTIGQDKFRTFDRFDNKNALPLDFGLAFN